jgi:hypothetical protein
MGGPKNGDDLPDTRRAEREGLLVRESGRSLKGGIIMAEKRMVRPCLIASVIPLVGLLTVPSGMSRVWTRAQDQPPTIYQTPPKKPLNTGLSTTTTPQVNLRLASPGGSPAVTHPSFQLFAFSSRTMSIWCDHVASVKRPVPTGYRGAPCWPTLASAVGDLISNPYPKALLLVSRQVGKLVAEEVPRCPLAVSPAASSRPDRHSSGGTFPLHLLPFLW